jgi:hypothetical protein
MYMTYTITSLQWIGNCGVVVERREGTAEYYGDYQNGQCFGRCGVIPTAGGQNANVKRLPY